MEFMLVFYLEPGQDPDPAVMAEMGRFAGGLSEKGKMRGGAPLHPDTRGARVRGHGRDALVTDGPFAETKEVIAGYFLIDCDDLDEAVAIAKECPHGRLGTIEVREVFPVPGPPSG